MLSDTIMCMNCGEEGRVWHFESLELCDRCAREHATRLRGQAHAALAILTTVLEELRAAGLRDHEIVRAVNDWTTGAPKDRSEWVDMRLGVFDPEQRFVPLTEQEGGQH